MTIGAPRDPRDYAFWLACHELECDLVYVLSVEHCKALGLASLDARRIDSIVRHAMYRYARACAPGAHLQPHECADVARLHLYRELGELVCLHAQREPDGWVDRAAWLASYLGEEVRERLVSAYGFERRDDDAAAA